MKQQELFSYTYDFISQLLDNKFIFDSVDKIILFGSVVRGDFRKESDLDLFVSLKSLKKYKEINTLIKKEINKFEIRCEKTWFLRGVDLPIKVVIGKLEEERWKELREEILSYGKVIYGKYERIPDKLYHNILITYNLGRLSQKKKMAFLRKLYGYTTKKGVREYFKKGLLEELEGEKLSPNTLRIRAEHLSKIKKLLSEFRIKYWLRDIWLK